MTHEEKLLLLALWLAETTRGRVEQLLADAEAGEGTMMPAMARMVLSGEIVDGHLVAS